MHLAAQNKVGIDILNQRPPAIGRVGRIQGDVCRAYLEDCKHSNHRPQGLLKQQRYTNAGPKAPGCP